MIGDATLGELRLDGVWFCWTLEDRVRAQKIKHETAIPAGEYVVTLTHSARFGVVLPQVNDVPEFSGIRIHPGNSAADTSGCILVGKGRNGERISDSREAFAALMLRLQQVAHNEVIVLRIHQPDAWPKWNDRVTVDLPARRPAPAAPQAPAMTGPLSPMPPQAATAPPVVPALGAPSYLPAQPVIGGGPEDDSRQVTRDGGKAWITTLLSWASGIGASAYGYVHSNPKIILAAIGLVALVTALWALRSFVLEILRMKYAADPSKYNVH